MKGKLRPLDQPRLRAISLGAGVQSTTVALMAAAGEILPMPGCAIFADTGAEPSYVYNNIAWLRKTLPFPVYICRLGDLARDAIHGRDLPGGASYPPLPYFLETGTKGGGRGIRGCTGPYKIRPIALEQRRILGVAPGKNMRPGSVEVWIGISTDEAIRMKPAGERWQVNRWPLIEAGMSREDCKAWLRKNGYSIPERSACVFCPYRSDAEWRRLSALDPVGFARACEVDVGLRVGREARGLRGVPYLHRSRRPLADVQFSEGPDLFGEECAGICGV